MKVNKNFSIEYKIVKKLDEYNASRPRMNRSMIVEDALELWFDAENEKAKEEFFKDNPDGF